MYVSISLFGKKNVKPLLLCYFFCCNDMLFNRKALSHQVQIDFADLQTLQQSSQMTKEPFSTKINIFK